MRFGPFSEQHLSKILPLLEAASIHFEVDHSAEALAEWRRAREERGPVLYPSFKGLVEGSFLEIADDDLSRLPAGVSDYGIFEPIDRPVELDAFDDFVCPKCDFSGHASQLCPRHLTPLVSFSQKVRANEIASSTRRRVMNCLLVAALLIVVFVRYCDRPAAGHRWVWPWEMTKGR